MHKVIVGATVVVLAGTCWVLAQNASSQQAQSPYRHTSGMLPAEKAQSLTVAPTTALGGDAPVTVPARPEYLPVTMPPLDPPPSVPQPPPSPITIPEIPPPPKSDLIIPTKSALPGLPPLPPVPGVNPGASHTADRSGPRYEGIIVPQPLKLPTEREPTWNGNQVIQGDAPAPRKDPAVPTQVDPPGYWQERQSWNLRSYPDRTIGPRVWGSADVLFWFVQSQSSPALIQAISTLAASSGVFDSSQAVTLFPYDKIDYGLFAGVRGTVGFWLTPMQTVGFEANWMSFERGQLNDGFRSDDFTILGRPFVDESNGRDSLYQVSVPGAVVGTIVARTYFEMQGGEANFLFNSPAVGPSVNLLAGFRYLDMSEGLLVSESSNESSFIIRSYDEFYTRNQFWGGQLGLRWTYEGRRLFANVTGKIGFGAMNERVRIDGNTYVSTSAGTTSATGGVLALASNVGTYDRTRTAFVPEAVVNLGYKFAPWGTITVGYNFLYSTEVVRPGSQIDNVVNTNNLPFVGGSTGRPGFTFKSEDIWIQGINFGLMLRY